MPLIINKEPPEKDKVITMGKADQPAADYYQPGATEPIVRPAGVPAPEPKAEPKAEPDATEAETVIGNKETKQVSKKK